MVVHEFSTQPVEEKDLLPQMYNRWGWGRGSKAVLHVYAGHMLQLYNRGYFQYKLCVRWIRGDTGIQYMLQGWWIRGDTGIQYMLQGWWGGPVGAGVGRWHFNALSAALTSCCSHAHVHT